MRKPKEPKKKARHRDTETDQVVGLLQKNHYVRRICQAREGASKWQISKWQINKWYLRTEN